MRSISTLAAASLLAFGCQCEHAPTPEATGAVETTPAVFNTGGAPTVTFDVPDMMCKYSCVDAVKTALAAQPGVKEVKVDFKTKQATVVIEKIRFDGEAAIASLVDYQFTNSQLQPAEENQPPADVVVPAVGVPEVTEVVAAPAKG